MSFQYYLVFSVQYSVFSEVRQPAIAVWLWARTACRLAAPHLTAARGPNSILNTEH
jgi:hypothetical protein